MAEQIKFDRCLYPHFRFYMREVRTVVYSQFVGILQERDGSCHASLQDSQSCRCFGDKECTLPGNNQARGFLAKQDPEAVSSHHHFKEFVNDYIFPCLRAGAIHDRKALLVLEIMLEAMVDVVAEVGADAVSHGWFVGTGNLWHLSHEGDILEDLANERKKHMYMMSVDPEDAPDQPEIADAEENLGESEVREAHLAKALYFIRISDKEKALEQLKLTEGKTVAVGQKMDLVFYTLQLAFFYMDFDLVSKSIDKAKKLFEEGGDWERKNRLKVYEGLYCMSTRNFKKAASLFLDSISTFTTYEIFPYETFIFYTVLTSIITLDRVSLKQKVVDAPEILTTNRQRLADCAIGFGKNAIGGRDGRIYVVTDSGNDDPVTPKPGTLRHAVVQDEPLWIIFQRDMTIQLKEELIMNSFKTIDGRGASVHIAGGPCITIQYVTNIIIHGIHIHDCKPGGNAMVRSSPRHYGWRTISDGDGVSIFGGSHVWVDHCSLSNCEDGLIDAIMGSTAITLSNNYMTHHDKVMLLGHSDTYTRDKNMQITIAFNHFGEGLVQRMPRCRHGYFHVVNNDYTHWEMYAIGGSADPTINSQGNRFLAPDIRFSKEVTKHEDAPESEWKSWNWRSSGDLLLNGAFFTPSGGATSSSYAKASSLGARPSSLVGPLTVGSGALNCRKGSRC
ncbi:hypothetical protein F2Q70_00039649 [Brassica cretica]|uniref:Pectate lyase n=1 Tax=Brassica cretica TaxID=69181 RepID=A0A8S9KBU3_BRACR|nr:hypothetical protein F2Q70_00039649 [Brassica cretica]